MNPEDKKGKPRNNNTPRQSQNSPKNPRLSIVSKWRGLRGVAVLLVALGVKLRALLAEERQRVREGRPPHLELELPRRGQGRGGAGSAAKIAWRPSASRPVRREQ